MDVDTPGVGVAECAYSWLALRLDHHWSSLVLAVILMGGGCFLAVINRHKV